MTLTIVGGHEHVWRRYILREAVYGETIKEYTQQAQEDIPGLFYVGYDCECGVDGYGS